MLPAAEVCRGNQRLDSDSAPTIEATPYGVAFSFAHPARHTRRANLYRSK
jgi:hypothetical protein